MARERKYGGMVGDLAVLPWWFGVGLGIVGFILLRWILPFMLPSVLKSAATVFHSFAWFALVLFCFLGLISFVCSGLGVSTRLTLRGRVIPTKSLARLREPLAEPKVNATSPAPHRLY